MDVCVCVCVSFSQTLQGAGDEHVCVCDDIRRIDELLRSSENSG